MQLPEDGVTPSRPSEWHTGTTETSVVMRNPCELHYWGDCGEAVGVVAAPRSTASLHPPMGNATTRLCSQHMQRDQYMQRDMHGQSDR